MSERYILDWNRTDSGAALIDTADGCEILRDVNCDAPEDACLGRHFSALVDLLNEQERALSAEKARAEHYETCHVADCTSLRVTHEKLATSRRASKRWKALAKRVINGRRLVERVSIRLAETVSALCGDTTSNIADAVEAVGECASDRDALRSELARVTGERDKLRLGQPCTSCTEQRDAAREAHLFVCGELERETREKAAAEKRAVEAEAERDEALPFEALHEDADGGVMSTSELHVFQNDCDTVIARDLDDAWVVYAETHGYASAAAMRAELEEYDALMPVSGDKTIRICTDPTTGKVDDNGKHFTTLTAAEWIAREGRGFLCSTEY